MKEEYIVRDGKTYKVVYTRFITRNGKKIYHPKGGVYRFEVAI